MKTSQKLDAAGMFTYLNQGKKNEHKYSTKQERPQEVEIMASACSPECVQSETHNHCSC